MVALSLTKANELCKFVVTQISLYHICLGKSKRMCQFIEKTTMSTVIEKLSWPLYVYANSEKTIPIMSILGAHAER